MKIGTRLALFFIIIIAAAIAVLSWLYTESSGAAMAERTDAQLNSVGLLKINQLDFYTSDEIHHLEHLAIIVSYWNLSNRNTVKSELDVLHKAQPDFGTLFIMDLNGTVVASTNASEEGGDASDETYFVEGRAGTFFKSYFYPPGSGMQPAYFITTPVKDESGRIVAVLGTTVNMTETSALMLEPAGMGMTGEVFLTDSYGVPITALKKTRNDTGPLHTLAVTECLKGNNGSATYPDYHGDWVIVRYYWLADKSVCLISKIDSSEALDPIEQIDREVTLAGAAFVVLALVAAILVIGRVLSPIEKLTGVVSAISKGDMSIELDPKLKESEDEIGKLARAFDRTVVSLKVAMKETAPELKVESRALKEALAERTRAEERYRALVKTSPDAVVVTDPAGTITEVSKRTLELFGVESSSELLGRDAYELLPPESREKARKGITGTLEARGLMEGVKLTLQRKDGTTFTGEVNINRLRDAAGRHIGTILALRDITRREAEDRTLREALEARGKAEARYKALVETAPVATTAVDVDGNVVEVSEQTLRLHGYGSADEVVGKSAYDLIAPEDRDRAREIAIKTAKAGHLEGVRYSMLRKDGSTFLGELNVRTLKDPAGKVYGFIGTTTDITKREAEDRALREALEKEKKAEAEVAGEKDILRRYLDIAGVMVVVIGADRKVAMINRRGCEILGYDESEIMGKNWFDKFIPKSDRNRTRETFDKLMRGEIKEVEYYENTIVGRDGKPKLIAWHNTVLREDGTVTGTLSSGEDISQRRVTEERINSLGKLCVVCEDVGHSVMASRSGIQEMPAVYQEACRTLVDKGGFRMVWVGLVDKADASVKPVAYAGVDKGYLSKVKISTVDLPEGRGPTGLAIRENRPIVVDDWAEDPRMKPWRKMGTERGYRSSAAFPLRSDGEVVGALNVYSEKPGFFDSEIVRMLQDVAELLSLMKPGQKEGKEGEHG